MSIISPFSLFESELEQVELAIKNIVASDDNLFSALAKRALFAGGKRIRPMLVILSGKLIAPDSPQNSALVASSFELVHVASLLHDDVIDDASLRRGHPAPNMTIGNKRSILLGDYLMLKSLDLLLSPEFSHLVPLVISTINEMILGEGLELQYCKNLAISVETSLEINRLKTAVLFANACKAGALVSNANEEQVRVLHDFGMNLGIAFQLVDDVLDYTGDEKQLGKPVFNDFKECKATIPLIYTLQDASDDEKQFISENFAHGSISENEQKEIFRIMQKYDAFDRTLELARSYLEKAISEIKIFEQSEIRDTLFKLSEFVLMRFQ